MSTGAASIVGTTGEPGPQGEQGEPGEPGATGSPGAVGPSGQASAAATATPGTSPAASDVDVVWPPADIEFPVGSMLTVEVWATCERDDTRARRTLNTRAIIASPNGGGVAIDGQQTGTSVNGTGWAGIAAIVLSIYTTGGGIKKLRIQGSGPNAAGSCTWIVSGAYVRQQSGLVG